MFNALEMSLICKRYFVCLLLLLLVGVVGIYLYKDQERKNTEVFDASVFNKISYTKDEFDFFCDVAFNRDGQRIRKWISDIRVEIKEPYKLNKESISEVDSIIAILAPLIAPLKIERVWTNGNVHVYRNVRRVMLSDHHPVVPIALKGLTKRNKETDLFWNIYFARVYVREGAHSQTLLHEFLHVLGLEHPLRIYPYYVTIGRSIIPDVLYGEKELAKSAIPFYMSEQEKVSIKMLYSPEIKPGLKKETFLEKIKIQ